MKQEYSLAHLTVLGCPPPEMTYIAARAGYDYVSIRPIYMGLPGEPDYSLAEKPQMLRQFKRALASTGVRVHDIELARVYEGLHPTKYLPAMEVAAEVGARAVLSSIWGGEREFYVEKFGEICDLARPFGLTVDLEYVPIATVNNLAMAVDVLCCALSGANWGPFAPPFTLQHAIPARSVGKGIGHFFGAMRIGAYIDPAEFGRQVDDYVRTLRATKPAPGTDGPLIPGDPERAAERERRMTGIPLVEAVVQDLQRVARETGVRLG